MSCAPSDIPQQGISQDGTVRTDLSHVGFNIPLYLFCYFLLSKKVKKICNFLIRVFLKNTDARRWERREKHASVLRRIIYPLRLLGFIITKNNAGHYSIVIKFFSILQYFMHKHNLYYVQNTHKYTFLQSISQAYTKYPGRQI